MTRKTRIKGLSLAILGLLSHPLLAADQKYPTKPIRLVVPFSAGGALDTTARVLAERMSNHMGQPVVVDNRTGAGGIIGVDNVAKAAPDGYTLSISQTSQLLVNQFLYKKLAYNPNKDFTLVAKIADSPLVLVVSQTVPVKDAKELRAYLTANQGKLSYGSWGVGTVGHLSASKLNEVTGAKMTHVSYRGEVPMVQDIIAGNVQLAFTTGLQANMFLKSGKLKAIGVTGTSRLPTLPNVPTLAEQGFDSDVFKTVGWSAIAAPAGTPPQIIQRLADEVKLATNLPEVRNRINDLGFVANYTGPTEFAALYQKQAPVWQAVVKESGASLD
ncbi:MULTISPECIES: Bug family tripartite tricarboxylate transporter substrate binding protein [unclassified Cupriavidus]|uniref:Bug family tripartite tricarboxylate transporter substrate binding protein n=1 Tax=unclassified Cupriavidus TaxID=2640874 RepID=UPI001C0004D0|nr:MULTISPECIES: tripartite tricarboxylate transporter substrate binding protein [unclassified Cupriavidus]MCA3183351.1 tripartite tricarboxylate transporter substrate binding protein [Cupriavidus sp.]MCA3194083.1 tripartite tricarboxylate transporter substrate binding protein [Cupriavidus sp.]MCA3200277.1 tripartite tricarboxylate transporter substrate binding protein [Cupriavidus sp.]MCA3236321.1 tripartite tricarboxylate transporter substrate binding protein [Cupriavidus sp.]QWE97590.1 trip